MPVASTVFKRRFIVSSPQVVSYLRAIQGRMDLAFFYITEIMTGEKIIAQVLTHFVIFSVLCLDAILTCF